jgi:tRNA threonylcarbamoyladenosine biosynthesis protein TsaB
MTEGIAGAEKTRDRVQFVLGVDTCGPSGSVALARVRSEETESLEQIELAGKTYSATLITAVRNLLRRAGKAVAEINAIVVTSGPGSFTGVRVGLSAVKGLAEPSAIPVVAVSRLGVLARKAGAPAAALDAHRHEVFLRLSPGGSDVRELLAGRAELDASVPFEGRIAVCDEEAANLLMTAWPHTELARVAAPTAADAIQWALPRILAGEFAHLETLDGHYLRRSDAEIFGEAPRRNGQSE